MTEQRQRRSVGVAGEVGNEVRAAGLGGEQRDLETGVAESLGKQVLRAVLVAGRVDRVECDQFAEQVDRASAEVGFGKRRLLAHAVRLLLHTRPE